MLMIRKKQYETKYFKELYPRLNEGTEKSHEEFWSWDLTLLIHSNVRFPE